MAVFCAENIEEYALVAEQKNFIYRLLQYLKRNTLSSRKVLVKPNFLKPSHPDKGIITHPSLLVVLFEVLKDLGAQIYLGDSPGFGSLEGVLNKANLFPAIRRYGVKLADFSRLDKIKPKNSLIFRELELPSILFEMDEIFNVPKLKTHQMMLLTLAVKNLYGCVYGIKKVKFHLTAGESYETFATLLLDIYLAIKPSVNILDGIYGMEGDGPSAGTLRKFGFIAASDDALTLDFVVTKLLSIEPKKVPYLKVAIDKSLIETSSVENKTPEFAITNKTPLKLPKSHAVNFSLPRVLNKVVKRFFLSYPWVTDKCKACGICLRHCPVSAITIKKEKANIDKSKCIRCFCCQELCEHYAILVKK